MKRTVFSNDFVFMNIHFSKYHYTDARSGAPLNYLAYMQEGEAKIVSEYNTIEVKKGDLFYIPKNLSYQSYWYGSDKIDFLSFGFQTLHTTEEHVFALQLLPHDPMIVKKLLEISGISTVNCKALSLFYEVMNDVIPQLKQSPESHEKMLVQRIKLCISRHPHHSLPEIADLCMISESYLYALFKKQEHITPNDYRQKILCDMGMELLLTTDKKLEEVTDLLGFSSSSYFRKVLKKHTGYTPKELRKHGSF